MNFTVHDGEEQSATIRRLLLKFGFDLPRYEEEYALLRERVSQFMACALELPPTPTEEGRARVRSVGVNLFVSVEQFLEDVVAYSVWMMASDHFTGTSFCYSKQAATALVPNVLGARLASGDAAFEWSTDGTNTLGCLLAYLDAFREWLSGRKDADRSAEARSEHDYPHYSKDTLQVFPFKHKALWADSAPESLVAYADAMERICTQLAQSHLPRVRNGLDHKRDEEEFPDADSLVACASRLQEVVDMADSNRVVPKLFWGVQAEHHKNGIVCDTFHDYRGSPICIWYPATTSGGVAREFGVPYLIAPFDFLNQPNSLLVFKVAPESPYRAYWGDYPRRRFIPSTRRDGSAECDGVEGEPSASASRA
jgi:hypothetical protein